MYNIRNHGNYINVPLQHGLNLSVYRQASASSYYDILDVTNIVPGGADRSRSSDSRRAARCQHADQRLRKPHLQVFRGQGVDELLYTPTNQTDTIPLKLFGTRQNLNFSTVRSKFETVFCERTLHNFKISYIHIPTLNYKTFNLFIVRNKVFLRTLILGIQFIFKLMVEMNNCRIFS